MTEQEFKSLLIPFKNLLYFVAQKVLNDQHEAEDVVQETYLKAWKTRSKLAEISVEKTTKSLYCFMPSILQF